MSDPDTATPDATELTSGQRIGRSIAKMDKGGIVFVIMLAVATVLLFVGLAYLCWVIAASWLWSWGFDPAGWHSLVAILGLMYLVIIPFLALILFTSGIDFWDEYGSVRRELTKARQEQGEIEIQLDATDPQFPLKLISYSRFMLKEYYIMAMRQAGRSYRYCLIAMWLGFIVLLAGVADYFIPLRALLANSFSLPETPQPSTASGLSPTEFVLITGVVLEFIAAAFLWVYRFSITQQTYYYRRQLKLHNVLLAKHVGDGMQEGKDAALKMIIQSLLENVDMTQSDLPTASGVKGFLKKG